MESVASPVLTNGYRLLEITIRLQMRDLEVCEPLPPLKSSLHSAVGRGGDVGGGVAADMCSAVGNMEHITHGPA